MQEIDFNRMAVGQSAVTDNGVLRTVGTRTGAEEMTYEQFESATGRLLYRMSQNVNTNAIRLLYYDKDFWTVTLNGRPLLPAAHIPVLRGISASPSARVMNLNT